MKYLILVVMIAATCLVMGLGALLASKLTGFGQQRD